MDFHRDYKIAITLEVTAIFTYPTVSRQKCQGKRRSQNVPKNGFRKKLKQGKKNPKSFWVEVSRKNWPLAPQNFKDTSIT